MISTISWGASVSFLLWFPQSPDSPNHSPSPLTKFSSVKYSNLVTRHYSVVLSSGAGGHEIRSFNPKLAHIIPQMDCINWANEQISFIIYGLLYPTEQGRTQHRRWVYRCTPDYYFQTKSKLVGVYCNWIQIRIQIVLLGFGVLRLAQHKEREGAGIPGRCSSPAKGWAKT